MFNKLYQVFYCAKIIKILIKSNQIEAENRASHCHPGCMWVLVYTRQTLPFSHCPFAHLSVDICPVSSVLSACLCLLSVF